MKMYLHDLVLMRGETSNETMARKYAEEIMRNPNKLILKECYEEACHKGKKKGEYILHIVMNRKEELEAEEKEERKAKEISLCDNCWTFTKPIKGVCENCKAIKKQGKTKLRKL